MRFPLRKAVRFGRRRAHPRLLVRPGHGGGVPARAEAACGRKRGPGREGQLETNLATGRCSARPLGKLVGDEADIADFGFGEESACWSQIGYTSGYTSAFMGRLVITRSSSAAARATRGRTRHRGRVDATPARPGVQLSARRRVAERGTGARMTQLGCQVLVKSARAPSSPRRACRSSPSTPGTPQGRPFRRQEGSRCRTPSARRRTRSGRSGRSPCRPSGSST